MRICAYCLTPKRWHLVLWPERDDELAAFVPQSTNKRACPPYPSILERRNAPTQLRPMPSRANIPGSGTAGRR